jgi:hypothetical protein
LDLAIALHACDTATDHALAKALRAGARAILLAPCCQRELAEQLDASALPFAAIGRQGLLARDYAAVVTDAIRVELLQAWGYRVDVLEFVGAEHSLKNLLIRAIKIRRAMPERVATLVEQLSHAKLSPCGLLHVLDPAAT